VAESVAVIKLTPEEIDKYKNILVIDESEQVITSSNPLDSNIITTIKNHLSTGSTRPDEDLHESQCYELCYLASSSSISNAFVWRSF
jgi:hypothetical protein